VAIAMIIYDHLVQLKKKLLHREFTKRNLHVLKLINAPYVYANHSKFRINKLRSKIFLRLKWRETWREISDILYFFILFTT